MFHTDAAALRADAERLRDCARSLRRPRDAAALRAMAAECEAAAGALEAQIRQLAFSAD